MNVNFGGLPVTRMTVLLEAMVNSLMSSNLVDKTEMFMNMESWCKIRNEMRRIK